MDDDNIERGPKAAGKDGGEGAGSARDRATEQPECVNAYGGKGGRGHFVLRKAFNEAVNHVDAGVGRGRCLRRK